FRLNAGFDEFGVGGIVDWHPAFIDITLSSSSAAVIVPPTCPTASSAPMMTSAPRRLSSAEDFVSQVAERPTVTQIIEDPDRRMHCRRVFQRSPLPFTNVTQMQDYVDVFHGTEQTGQLFAISSNFLGEYVMVDSTCSWDYTCDMIILIAGDHIRATRTPPTRTNNLVRGWSPEVVYTIDTILSNCITVSEPQHRRAVGAQPIAQTSIVLPAANLTTATRATDIDPSFEIPYPHLQYFSDSMCSYVTVVATRAEWVAFFGRYETDTVIYRRRHCEPVGQVGNFLANVTCGNDVPDASFLICDSILTIDTVQIVTRVVDTIDFHGTLFFDCEYAISYRFDSIWTFTCWRDCRETVRYDTTFRSGDTIIHYIFDSIVERRDTFFMIGNDYPQLLIPMLDTMDIVMEITTIAGCHILDTFRVIQLNVPREHIRDTFVSHGDTLHLFAESLDPNVSQWWVDLTEHYFISSSHALILDRYTTAYADGFTHYSRFVGDTLPMFRDPLAFRGDTVDIALLSRKVFSEHNVTCIVRDTVAIQIQSGFRIGGFISYDRFWDPGAPFYRTHPDGTYQLDIHGRRIPTALHRPVGNVTVELIRLSTNTVVATTVSDTAGFFQFEGVFPQDRYVLRGSAPEKYLVLNTDGGVTSNDAATLEAWIVDRSSKPFRHPDSSRWTERTMMYIAADVDENILTNVNLPASYFGINNNDVRQILDATVGNFRFPQIIISGNHTYETGSFYRQNEDFTDFLPVDDWKFSNDTIYLDAHTDNFQMMGVMMGDADLSYFPGGGHFEDVLRRRVAARSPSFELLDTIFVNSRDRFINVPVLALQDGEVRAFQLHINNLPSNVEVLNITPGTQNMRLVHNIRGRDVLFSWITNGAQPISFRKGDVIANLVIKVNSSTARAMRQIPKNFTFEPTGYGAWDGTGTKITNEFRVALPVVAIDNNLPIIILDSIIGDIEDEFIADTATEEIGGGSLITDGDIQTSQIINIIPNPMTDHAMVTYSISEEAIVTMRLINLLGIEVKTLMNGVRQDVGIFRQQITSAGIPNGVYILRLETVTATRRDVAIEKVVINR
ncbi:MAG: hypothetical protein FWC98_01445, partial [Bacteroidales bacterium]|nr:hypothetical protein [Bacteroidales bacterium]